MFEDARAMAVIAASDIERARSFYEGVLGLEPVEVIADEESAIYQVGGVPLLVYKSGYAGTAKNTVFAIQSTDLDRDMAALRDKGVAFEEYDFPGLQTVNGVAELPTERSAWFPDSEGNLIALTQRTS